MLYKAIAPLIAKAIATSIGITAVLFIFTYFPQVVVCALFSGPFAPVTAVILVLFEASCLISIVSKVVFLGNAQDRICMYIIAYFSIGSAHIFFIVVDAVLLHQGNETLVEKGRQIRSSSGFKVLGKSLTKPLSKFSQEGILRYIITLPLNSVPGIGTVLFLLYNGTLSNVPISQWIGNTQIILGKKIGPSFHAHYFQLKNYNQVTREEYVEKRRGAYTMFVFSVPHTTILKQFPASERLHLG